MLNIDTLDKNKKYIVCVSTGIDSSVLLDLLIKNKFDIIVCHVNHNKRKESINEYNYLKDYLKKKNIILEYLLITNYDKNNNFHDEARKKRYEFFINIANKYNIKDIILAHHLNDQLETIIDKITRGSTLKGYAGIYEKEIYNNIVFHRPLLKYTKDEIIAYQKENNVDYFLDESNLSNDYKRNRIRHNVIPYLEKEQKNLYKKIYEYHNILKEAYEFIRKKSYEYLEKYTINDPIFYTLDDALKKDIILLFLEKNNIRPSYKLINQIYNVIKNKTNKEIHIKDNKKIIYRYKQISVKNKKTIKNNTEVKLKINESVIYNNKYKFYFSNKKINNVLCVKICYNIKNYLLIRNRKEKDKISFSFGTKTLKKFFIDKKIDKDIRDELPIVTLNDEIIFIYGCYKKDYQNEDFIYLMCEEMYEQHK